MIRVHLAVPLLAVQLVAVDAAAEETAPRRGRTLGYSWSSLGGDFDIPAGSDFVTVPLGLSGPGSVRKWGSGELRLHGANTYTGGTHIAQGVLQVGNGQADGSIVGDVLNHGLLEFDRGDDVSFAGRISGRGSVHFLGSGTMTLTGDHSYTGITALANGRLRLGDGGVTGSLASHVYNHGAELVFDRRDTLRVTHGVYGYGTLVQAGTGATILSGPSSHHGKIQVRRGTLILEGAQAGITGQLTVWAGATLAGSGTVGSSVLIEDGATLRADRPDATLAMKALVLRPGAALRVSLDDAATPRVSRDDAATARVSPDAAATAPVSTDGAATPRRPRFDIEQDLTLDGTLHIAGSAERGLHPLFAYGGTLTDRTLEIGDVPDGTRREAWQVRTSRPGHVDLLHDGGRPIRFYGHGGYWRAAGGDSAGGTAGDARATRAGVAGVAGGGVAGGGVAGGGVAGGGVAGGGVAGGGVAGAGVAGAGAGAAGGGVAGGGAAGASVAGASGAGAGAGRGAGATDWSHDGTIADVTWTDNALAVFGGHPGTVIVDDSAGAVRFSGAQFLVTGYTITGPGTLTTDAPDTVLRVGDPTVATIDKDDDVDFGTGTGTGTGNGNGNGNGTGNGNGNGDGKNMRATITANIAGPGGLVKSDPGTLVLHGINRYTGGTTLKGGAVEIRDDNSLGAAHAPLTFDGGKLRVTADITASRPVKVGAQGGGLDTGAHTVRWTGPYTGIGTLTKTGTGTLELAGRNAAEDAPAVAGNTSAVAPNPPAGTARTPGVADHTLAVAAGTLRAGAPGALGRSTRIVVRAGATLDTAGMPQVIAGLDNAGLVTLGPPPGTPPRGAPSPGPRPPGAPPQDASTVARPGNVLVVRGDYIGRGGVVRLRTHLGGSDSPTDQLVIDGGRATGLTHLAIVNTGGLGARTLGDGIEVIRAINGATTTAQTTRDAFALQGHHVDAGAYEYRLYPGDANGKGESWYLRSTAPGAMPATAGAAMPAGVQGATPTAAPGATAAMAQRATRAMAIAPGRTTYRPETALYAALPAVLAQADLAMLGNLHRREGELPMPGNAHRREGDLAMPGNLYPREVGLATPGSPHAREGDGAVGAAPDAGASRRRAWGRVIDQQTRIRQQGTVAPRSAGWTSGVQLGADLYADPHHRAGLYGGTLGWRHRVHGDASGDPDRAVGRLQGRSNHIGAYWTYRADAGWYADMVLQHGRQRGKGDAAGGGSADIRASSTLASLETGAPLRLGGRWTGEPQAQLIAAHRHIGDVELPAATVRQHPGNTVIARLGLRLRGDYAGRHGQALPYARLNVWHGLSGTDAQSIQGPGGGARITESRGYTSGELAAGGTWVVNRHIGLYGEIGRLFPLGGGQRVSAGHAISAGMRIAW